MQQITILDIDLTKTKHTQTPFSRDNIQLVILLFFISTVKLAVPNAVLSYCCRL